VRLAVLLLMQNFFTKLSGLLSQAIFNYVLLEQAAYDGLTK